MKFIENACAWWKFWSVRAAAVQSLTIMAWITLPQEYKTPALQHVFELVVWVQGLFVMFVRAVKQEKLNPTDIQQLPKDKP